MLKIRRNTYFHEVGQFEFEFVWMNRSIENTIVVRHSFRQTEWKEQGLQNVNVEQDRGDRCLIIWALRNRFTSNIQLRISGLQNINDLLACEPFICTQEVSDCFHTVVQITMITEQSWESSVNHFQWYYITIGLPWRRPNWFVAVAIKIYWSSTHTDFISVKYRQHEMKFLRKKSITSLPFYDFTSFKF